jgi:cell division protein FtsA
MLKQITGASKKALQRVKMPQLPQRGTERFVVALDIGTENVKALIASIRGDSISIIGVGKAHQALSDMQAGAIADIEAVTANCDAALAEAEEQAGISGFQVVIGIAGELVKGTTNTVRVKRKDAKKPLDESEIDKIIQLVQERAYAKAKKQLALEMGGKEVEVRLVNSALVRLQIDGYDITNPIGFQGGEVVVQLYTAFAPMIHIGALERVAQMLDLELLAVAAEPYAVARAVIGDSDANKMSAILMDIGGGTTDIAVVHEGGVEGTRMFGIGGRAYTKSIEKNMGVTYAQAEAIKLGLSDGRVPHQKVPSIEAALAKTLSVWSSGVQLALDEFTVDTLPHSILLCGGGASLDMLVESLERPAWRKQLPFTRAPIVRRITPEDVEHITDTTNTLQDHTFITAMGLLRVGADTLGTAGLVGKKRGIKDKVNKLLKV